jgi:hypothetical protein
LRRRESVFSPCSYATTPGAGNYLLSVKETLSNQWLVREQPVVISPAASAATATTLDVAAAVGVTYNAVTAVATVAADGVFRVAVRALDTWGNAQVGPPPFRAPFGLLSGVGLWLMLGLALGCCRWLLRDGRLRRRCAGPPNIDIGVCDGCRERGTRK